MRRRNQTLIGPAKPNGTKIEYLYRDYGNWKFWGEFYLAGNVTFDQIKNLLFDGLWFVPEGIGIESLRPEISSRDDHWLHEIHAVSLAPRANPLMTAEDFVGRLRWAQHKGWWNLCPW